MIQESAVRIIITLSVNRQLISVIHIKFYLCLPKLGRYVKNELVTAICCIVHLKLKSLIDNLLGSIRVYLVYDTNTGFLRRRTMLTFPKSVAHMQVFFLVKIEERASKVENLLLGVCLISQLVCLIKKHLLVNQIVSLAYVLPYIQQLECSQIWNKNVNFSRDISGNKYLIVFLDEIEHLSIITSII